MHSQPKPTARCRSPIREEPIDHAEALEHSPRIACDMNPTAKAARQRTLPPNRPSL